MKLFGTALATLLLMTTSAVAETIKISIVKEAGLSTFKPPNVTAKPGDVVEWTNNDNEDHTVTPRNSDAFPAKEPITTTPPNNVHRITISATQQTGLIGYFCAFHGMPATITVVAP
jgi:plastocyanin